MPLLISELIFGAVNTISISTEAIFIGSLLIIFTLLACLFNNILSNQANQLSEKIDFDSKIELVEKNLENQFKSKTTILDKQNVDKISIRKRNFLPPSKLFGLSSLAVVAIGGTSLLTMQHMQKSYDHVNTSQANSKLVNQSIKFPVSMVDLKALDKIQTNIKKIRYTSPFLLTFKSSKNNNYYQVKGKKIETNFSF